jgi:hypothetical protein
MIHTQECGAWTRDHGLCRNPPEAGHHRCRLHGGAPGSGAPRGERNGRYLTGDHTHEARAERAALRQKVQKARQGFAPSAEEIDPRPIGATVRRVDSNYRVAEPPAGMERYEWLDRLRDAFGGASPEFCQIALSQLLECAGTARDFVPTSASLSAALEVVRGLAPRDPAEAAMALHIASLHMVSLTILARAGATQSTRTAIEAAKAAAKLERVLFDATATYHRLRRGNQQVIRIERVVVEEGAQAVIGFAGGVGSRSGT